MPASTREARDPERAWPWLTACLLLACAVGFAAQRVAEGGATGAAERELAAAAGYFAEHPHLDAPPLLAARLGAGAVAEAKARFEAEQRARAAPPIPSGVARRRQEELETRVAQAEAQLAALPARRLGLGSAAPAASSLAGHLFLHAGWLHLLGSLAALALVGTALEAALGAALMGGLAALSAAGAALAFAQLAPAGALFVGPWGLVAGLWGALLVRRAWDAPAGSGAGLALGLLVLFAPAALGLELSSPGASLGELAPGRFGASGFALLGGLGAGALAALLARALGLEAALAPGAGQRGDPRLSRALALAAGGQLPQAFEALRAELARKPDAREAALAFWDVAQDLGRSEAAAPALLRAIRDEIAGAEDDAAVAHWLALSAAGHESLADTGLLLRIAVLLRRAGETLAAKQALRAALERTPSAAAASRIAREAAELDAATAQEAAWSALGSLDLDLRERQELEALLSELQPRLPKAWSPGAVAAGADARPHAAVPAAPAPGAPGAGAIEFEARMRRLHGATALPLALDSEGIQLEVAGGEKKRVRYDRIGALAVAAIEGLSERPVIVVDLVLNWSAPASEPLQVIRLRSDRFDPRRLAPGDEPATALRALLARLLRLSGATPLPDLQSVQGVPFAGFRSLAAYQRDVLLVEE
jgi:membrane associated rhomboid family serine protease